MKQLLDSVHVISASADNPYLDLDYSRDIIKISSNNRLLKLLLVANFPAGLFQFLLPHDSCTVILSK